jgi:two-component system sensor histidine kinase ChvG
MASDTDTTKPEPAWRAIWSSPIARRIFLGNFIGLLILILGASLLSEMRVQLIQAKIDSLTIQGEVVANVLAETATLGDPAPQLLEQRARTVLLRLALPNSARVRLYTPDGELVADTNTLADRITQRTLPGLPVGEKDANGFDAKAALEKVGSFRLRPWRPDFTEEAERARAASGELVAGQRLGALGERVVSVSLPIQRVEAVIGVLTVEAGDVDEIIRRERRAMLPFFVGAWAVTALASFLLAFTIAIPLRGLAEAADSLRLSGATRLELPLQRRRQDEIGDLAQSLEAMTGSLAERIDANERFAADVSHEIKNPLTSIRSAVETARAVKDDGDRARLLAIIAQDVGRLDRLVTDIARASRLEAETARGAAGKVDLGRLLADICDTYGQTRRDGEAVVSFKGPPPAGAIVIGQEGPLGQVFRNLIDNAKSFSPQQGVVTVEVQVASRRDGGGVRAIVSDQGQGIEPANLESVFQRFYTDRPKGVAFGGNSGLGLSIARQIVQAYKGRIWAENIPGLEPGQRLGARFVVDLPGLDS